MNGIGQGIDYSLILTSFSFMPKRPSTVAFTTDQKTILSADKFGDVYALPLIPHSHAEGPNGVTDSDEPPQGVTEGLRPSDIAPNKPNPKIYVPSANPLTVHTKKNLMALQHQQRMAHQVSQKKTAEFEHELLLGHVSLLTDLACVTIQNSLGPRSYIITSDRDEHIRVSRGIPQTHVIEGYCQGHAQFVSKICILPWRTTRLVSGGGDDYLLSWDWLEGTINQQIDVKGPLNLALESVGLAKSQKIDSNHGNLSNVAVSGIWPFQSKSGRTQLLVTCEGFVC